MMVRRLGIFVLENRGRFAKTIPFSSRRITESMKNRESLARQKKEAMPRACLSPVGLKLSGPKSFVSVLKEELPKAI